MRLPRLLTPRTVASAHCDLPCGVYDPAQARIEAESVKAICEKYQATRPRVPHPALIIKEQRAELVKHHLWVLWTDYFKPPHFEKYPNLHQLFNEATKLAGASGPRARRPGQGRAAARQDRRDRQDLLGDQAGVSLPPYQIRPARPSDVPAVVAMVHELAAYERAPEQCHLTDDQLHAALFGRRRRCSATSRPEPAADAVRIRPLVPQLLHLGGRARHLPGRPVRTPQARGSGPGARCWRRWPASVSTAATAAWTGGCCAGTRPGSSTPASAPRRWTSGCRTGSTVTRCVRWRPAAAPARGRLDAT
jgi:nickel superoxide dismutase